MAFRMEVKMELRVEVKTELKMEVITELKMEVKMKVKMDAPILRPNFNYTEAQRAPVYVDGKIGASILTSISTSILTSNFDLLA